MPVWWGTFIYMLIVSAIGMALYNNKKTYAIENVSTDKPVLSDRSIGIIFALLTFLLLVYFVGQRSYMFDSTDYQYSYTNYFTTDLSQIRDIWGGTIKGKGKLFMTLLVLFKHFSGDADYNAWFLFLATVQCLSVARFLYKYSVNFTLSIFLFFTSSCFLWFVNGIRQFLAVVVILFFVDFIKDRKLIPFLIVIFLAYNIHSTAIVWIPIYLIINFEPWSKKFIISSLVLTAIFFVLSTSTSFLNDTEYSYLTNNAFKTGINPFRVIFMSIPAIICLIKRKEINEIATPFVKNWVNLSVIISEFYIVGMFTSGVIGRVPIYFQMFNYLLLPWIFKHVLNVSQKQLAIAILVFACLFYFYYDMYIAGNGIYNSIPLNLHYLN